jgi:dihydroorotase
VRIKPRKPPSKKAVPRRTPKQKPLLIRGGHLIDPGSGIDAPMDMLLFDGRVAKVSQPGKISAKGTQLINAKGLIVAPGFIDIHVHLREPGQSHKETIATGTAAAAAGGFTSVCCMPNTVPVNDDPKITHWMQSADRGAVINVFPIAAATLGSMGERITDFAALREAGAVAFSDDGKPILSDDIMRACLEAAAKLGVPVIQHAEDTRLTVGCSMNLGPTSLRLGLRGMSVESEAKIVERDIRLARETGGHLHVAHISTKKALDAVRRAKREGVKVTCEVTPHHFVLIDEHVGQYNTNYKMCPPLRSEEDRDAMVRGLLDGTIDCIATDHAPHAFHEKQQEFERAPMGITGLETALPIALQVLHHHNGLPLRRIVELLSTNPAKIVGLKGRGTLATGSHADVTLFDPKKKWKFYAQDSRSKSKNTPFDGWEFRGANWLTITNGKVIFTAKGAKER